MARTFETDPEVALVAIEIDRHARAARRNFNKSEMVIECLTRAEIAVELGFVFGSQRIGPAVSKILRLVDDRSSAPGIDRRDLVGFAIDPDEGRMNLRPVGNRMVLVFPDLRDQL